MVEEDIAGTLNRCRTNQENFIKKTIIEISKDKDKDKGLKGEATNVEKFRYACRIIIKEYPKDSTIEAQLKEAFHLNVQDVSSSIPIVGGSWVKYIERELARENNLRRKHMYSLVD
jgi:hypothetical protein